MSACPAGPRGLARAPVRGGWECVNDHEGTEVQRGQGMTGRDSGKSTGYEVSLVPVGSSLGRAAQPP